MKEYKPPISPTYPDDWDSVSVFLAGSIEMGKAEDWQTKLVNEFKDRDNLSFYNPRRDDWDSSWEQKESNLQFRQQVNWELDNLKAADLIFIYFATGTKSPISLLELGLYADSGKMIVCCPSGFWRKGNVDIVCTRHNIPQYETFEKAIQRLKLEIDKRT